MGFAAIDDDVVVPGLPGVAPSLRPPQPTGVPLAARTSPAR